MAALTYQDILFTQGSDTTASIDASQPAQSVARRVSDYQGYSFNVSWTGSPSGTLTVRLCNASVLNDAIVEPAQWVTLPDLTLTIGSGSSPAASPALIDMLFSRAGWASLLWTPSGGSGTISAKFDGVRR